MSAEITAWLDEAQAADDATTRGPWVEVGRDDPLLPPGAVTTAGKPGYRQIICEHASFDAAFIADARTRLPQAIAALRAVLDLHRPLNELGSPPCATCLADDDGEAVFELWPCPTARTIAAALGVQP